MTDLAAIRAENRAKMFAWVETKREQARAIRDFDTGRNPKVATDPHDFLRGWHDDLGRRMSLLPSDVKGAEGLTAFDLAEAQTKLLAPL